MGGTPGTLIYEPPGDIHTLIVNDPEGMTTLFVLEGVVQYLNDDDTIKYQDDIFAKMERYYRYCRSRGLNR